MDPFTDHASSQCPSGFQGRTLYLWIRQAEKTVHFSWLRGSLSFTRRALYETLAFVHRKSFPRCDIKSFADDTPQVHTGPEEVIYVDAVDQATDFVDKLASRGSTISGKSVLVATCPALATHVQAKLQRHGIQSQVAESDRDLGVDFTPGARRRMPIQAT